jgi:hypothetical protein
LLGAPVLVREVKVFSAPVDAGFDSSSVSVTGRESLSCW